MEDKCFCHLNGFRVKDAEARNEISNIKETYATKEYVLENATGGEIDLSDYATKEYVDTAIEGIEPGGSSGSSNVVEYVLPIDTSASSDLGISGNIAITPGTAKFSVTLKNKMSEIITDLITKYGEDKAVRLIILNTYSNGVRQSVITLDSIYFTGSKPTSVEFKGASGTHNYKLIVNGSWGETFTCTSANFVNTAELSGTTYEGTFDLVSGDVTEGASATWKETRMGKMVVLDVSATVPAGNELSGCYFRTSGIGLPNGIYGTGNSDIKVVVTNAADYRCELFAYNGSAVTLTHRLQLIYFMD